MSRDICVVPVCASRPAAAIFQHFSAMTAMALLDARTGRSTAGVTRLHRCVGGERSHNSSQSLPAPLLVRLPIGDIEALRLALAPALARGRDRVGILSVNDEHDAPIGVGIR